MEDVGAIISGIIFILGTILLVISIVKGHKLLKNQENVDEARKTIDICLGAMAISAVVFVYCLHIVSMGIIRDSITKPIIYMYSDQEIDVDVKVSNPEKLTCTYPKYDDGWSVTTKSNGMLEDKKTGRSLYALYWEGEQVAAEKNNTEGFVVYKANLIPFLEEKLSILGLNEREAEEFIVYWLPILEENDYNFIRFETKDEINNRMMLDITPKPDTLIRILMDYKPVNKDYEYTEQVLENQVRNGFTVVEWGGVKTK